jgi:hypothetical protein
LEKKSWWTQNALDWVAWIFSRTSTLGVQPWFLMQRNMGRFLAFPLRWTDRPKDLDQPFPVRGAYGATPNMQQARLVKLQRRTTEPFSKRSVAAPFGPSQPIASCHQRCPPLRWRGPWCIASHPCQRSTPKSKAVHALRERMQSWRKKIWKVNRGRLRELVTGELRRQRRPGGMFAR